MVFSGLLHIASALAVSALLAWSIGGKQPLLPVATRQKAAMVVSLAAFLFLPPGSLPPLVGAACGALLFFCLFACALWLLRVKPYWSGILPFCTTFGILAWLYYQKGVPGNACNFGTYAAMPYWQFTGVWDGFACVLLALAAFLVLRPLVRNGKENEWGCVLSGMAACAVWVAVFLPVNAAPVADLPVRMLAGLDVVFFWVKTAGVYFLAGVYAPRTRMPFVWGMILTAAAVLYHCANG